MFFLRQISFLVVFFCNFLCFFFDTSGCLFVVCFFCNISGFLWEVSYRNFIYVQFSQILKRQTSFNILDSDSSTCHFCFFLTQPLYHSIVSLIPRNRISLHFQNPRICFGKNWLSSGFLASPPPCQVSPTIREREGGKKGNKRTLTAQPGVENRIKSKYGLSGKILFISIFFISWSLKAANLVWPIWR